MSQRILIPCYTFAGHHLEYLKDFYHYAIHDNDKNHEYVFAVVESFKKEFAKLPHSENISVVSISSDSAEYANKGNRITSSIRFNRLTNKLARKYEVTDVLFLAYSHSFLAQSLMALKRVSYSGIQFQVYPYEYPEMTLKNKILTVIPHWLNVHCPKVKNIFIANDLSGVKYLNKLFRTDKHKYIPDPFVPINTDFDAEQVLGVDKKLMDNKFVLFHFGAMRPNKGTIELLEAIDFISPDIAKRLCFVIAGKVPAEMHDKVYGLIQKYSKKTTIIFHDEFCSFEYIAAVCQRADYILMPYKMTYSSSGMYGYAAQFGVPVVASNKNMTKKIVNRFHLGILLNDITAKGLAKFYESLPSRQKYIVGKTYMTTNTVEEFNKAIFSQIFK